MREKETGKEKKEQKQRQKEEEVNTNELLSFYKIINSMENFNHCLIHVGRDS